MIRWFAFISLLGALMLAGCDKAGTSTPGGASGPGAGAASSASGATAASDPDAPTKAQPKLQTMKLWMGPEEIEAELALTVPEQRTGMMFRTNFPEGTGMLFPLPYTQQASFWMKNCPQSMSAAYISPEGVIVEIHKLEKNNTNSVTANAANIRFVLEMPEGWFERHNIKPGTAIRGESGPLMETFFPGRN